METHSRAQAAAAGHAATPGAMQDAWQLLELAAIHYPDTLAVVDCAPGGGRLLTYQQLHARAARTAAWLRRRGVRRGDRVGLLSRNSSLVIELHYAAAALHAVVVNLNIHLAPRELAFILADSGPRLVLADRAYAGALLAALAERPQQRGQGRDGEVMEGVPGGSAAGQGLEAVVWLDVEPATLQQLATCDTTAVEVRSCVHDFAWTMQHRPSVLACLQHRGGGCCPPAMMSPVQ